MKTNTFTNHPPLVSVAADNPPLVAPIYQSVKFAFDDLHEAERNSRGERDGYAYSRIDNPTLQLLQQTLLNLHVQLLQAQATMPNCSQNPILVKGFHHLRHHRVRIISL